MLNIYTSQILTDTEVDKLIDMQESWIMDKKGKDISPNKLSRTISALANSNGGDIYLGISCKDDKNQYFWDGFVAEEDADKHLEIIDSTVGNNADYNIESFVNDSVPGIVYHIQIHKCARIIYSTDHIAYKRIGTQCLPCKSADEIRRLELEKGISSYEDDVTKHTFDNIKNSSVLTNFIKNVVPSVTPYDWFRKQQLMNTEAKITVAGLLLYDEYPQAVLPKRSSVRIVRYLTDDAEGTRETMSKGFPVSIEGDIYSLIKESVKKVIETVELTAVVGDFITGKKYPEIALHEIIANAVLHRDYSIATDIQIRIFSNRIEVESPGRLPGYITIDNILKERFSRNTKIVNIISRFPSPPNKDLGEGLNTAFREMTNMKLQKPQIIELSNSVLVIIKHERLADAETIVMDYLENHSTISNPIARDLTGISDADKMKRVFYRLREKGHLMRVPGAKGNKSLWKRQDCSLDSYPDLIVFDLP